MITIEEMEAALGHECTQFTEMEIAFDQHLLESGNNHLLTWAEYDVCYNAFFKEWVKNTSE